MKPPLAPASAHRGAGEIVSGPAETPTALAWDRFLEKTPLGQFQQSSRWAAVKALDGWRRELVLVDPSSVEAGGLQVLWKPTRLGRIGYVSKGPVLADETASSIDATFEALAARARALHLRALIVQPPDDSKITDGDLTRHHFAKHPIPSVISATAFTDLSGGREAILTRVNRKTRQNARSATKAGVTIRRAERDTLPRFFELMRESCDRQHERPNPNRVELLQALWDAFSPHVMLAVASIGRVDICGMLMIGHGRRMTLWKKGGTEEGNRLQANSLLMLEALGWAADAGYTAADFVGIDPEIAKAHLLGEPLGPEQLMGQDVFKLRFAAEPKLLPPAKLLVVDPLIRCLCRPLFADRRLQTALLRKLIVG